MQHNIKNFVNIINGDKMNHEIDLANFELRNDLAIESIEKHNTVDGIKSKIEKINGLTVTDVLIEKEGSSVIGKKEGNYITIEFTDVTDEANKKNVEEVFVYKLKELLKKSNINKNDSCFIVGLGNDKSTPDSLGPLSASKVIVTNHLFELGELADDYRRVWAIVPGVKGTTGIETSDVISSIIQKIKPDFLIVIDALASQSTTRVNKTIQMTDTGISPGGGIGNNRKEISKDILGIPVIAIGVPTTVDAVTIVSDTIGYMYKHFSYLKQNLDNPSNKLMIGTPNYLNKDIKVDKNDKSNWLGLVGSLEEDEIRQLISEVLTPVGNLMVTPKEVDFVIEKLSDVIANGINAVIHI